MNVERLEWMKEFGYTADSVFENGEYEILKHLLLGFGGVAVILPGVIDNYDKLVQDGEFRNDEAKKVGGIGGKCHTNSEKLASSQPHYKHMYGFALSDDEVWREHSWVWNTKADEILETTESRIGYFGIGEL